MSGTGELFTLRAVADSLTSPSQPAAPDSVPAASAKSGDVDMVQKEGDEDDDSDDDIVILI